MNGVQIPGGICSHTPPCPSRSVCEQRSLDLAKAKRLGKRSYRPCTLAERRAWLLRPITFQIIGGKGWSGVGPTQETAAKQDYGTVGSLLGWDVNETPESFEPRRLLRNYRRITKG